MSKQGTCLAVLALGMFGLQCNRHGVPVPSHEEHVQSESPAATGEVRLSAESRELAGIEVEKVKAKECKSVLRAMGELLAPQPQKAIVSHVFSGRVAEVHVQVGDWVEKGQALIILESLEVGEAKSNFYKAVADRELAELNLTREKRLLDSGIGIKKNYVAAETACKIAQSNAEAAEKNLHVLGFTEQQVREIADTHQISPTITLFAPIAGKVVASKAVLGALVDQSTEILTIIDPTLLWVDAEIYEKDIAKVKIGQEVEITVPAFPGEVFRGKVSYIGDIVDEETRTTTVRAEVANDDFRLKPGMFADVQIILNGREKMTVVPSAAVLEEGEQKIVFVQQDDHFTRREVETGAIDGDDQQIVAGLNVDEEVVIEGSHQLRSELQEGALKATHTH